MCFYLLRIILIFLILFCFGFAAQASNPQDMVINELAWMGTNVSYNDEWIELYNNTNHSINLEGWLLKTIDGSLEINLSGTVQAFGFYLLERTDDTTLPEITADQIYKGALGNEGEDLELFDNQNNLIDVVNCGEGWFAGDNSTKQTMERENSNSPGSAPENWQTSQNKGGTPKDRNIIIEEARVFEAPEETKAEVHPSGVVINEILPSPFGGDAEEEWIEVFNTNGFEVDLSDWQISDKIGSSSTFNLPSGIKISSFGFLVFSRTKTKIILNNDGDEISLLKPDRELTDAVNYGKAPLGKSYARQNDNWLWTATLTPGKANVITEGEVEGESQNREDLSASSFLSGIVINEILPSPEGSDAEEEWIELFNQNTFKTNISGWMVEDAAGKIKRYSLPPGTEIEPQAYLVLSRPVSKITLNNDSDGLKLLNPAGEIIDQVSYQRAPQGKSYNRTPLENGSLTGQAETEWVWSDNLTPGSPNAVATQTKETNKELLEPSEKQTANIGNLLSKIPVSLFILFSATVLAIFSGVIILSLKNKIKRG